LSLRIRRDRKPCLDETSVYGSGSLSRRAGQINPMPRASLPASGGVRDNHWAFDVLNVDGAVAQPPVTSVPEPGSLGMLGFGFLAAGWLAWRRRRYV
jgi:hypothetical protein